VKMTIFKYQLSLVEEQVLLMPHARLLAVAEQGGKLMLWAMHVLPETDADMSERKIVVRGTGHTFEPSEGPMEYIGTVQMGPFVWHVFDGGEV
jgi:hypothetical protein